MHQYWSKCRRCGAKLKANAILLPVKYIWHDLVVHNRLFTESWNPAAIVKRHQVRARDRKDDEFTARMTRAIRSNKVPRGKKDE
jgi:hypothetical protein